MSTPIILFALAVYSTFVSFLFRPAKAIVVLILTLVAGGLVAYFSLGALGVIFGVPFAAIPCGVGLASGALLKTRTLVGGSAAVVLLACFGYPLITLTKEHNTEENEKALLDSWIRGNAELMKLDEGNNTYDPRVTSQAVGYSNGSRYLFSLGNARYYIVVDSFRRSGRSEFRITCIATMEERDKGKRCDLVPRPPS